MAADALRHGTGRRVRQAPWSAEQAARLIVSNLVVLTGIVTTAYGAASADETQTVLLWFNLCVASLAFAGVSNALWLVRCHNTASTWRADVLDAVGDAIRLPDTPVGIGHGDYVVASGLRRYHLADCAFVAGRSPRPATAKDLTSGRLSPCEVCIR